MLFPKPKMGFSAVLVSEVSFQTVILELQTKGA